VKPDAEILILGGGLAGLSFAVALASADPDLRITLLEAHGFEDGTPDPMDTRASALNLHSTALLDRWGMWQALETQSGAITDIHVSHRGHFGSTVMTAIELDAPALGYVVENHVLGRHLLQRAETLGVEVRAPVRCKALHVENDQPVVQTDTGDRLQADLALLAAGVTADWFHTLGIAVSERTASTGALVFNASFAGRQQGRAFERFTAHGPLAVLPLPSASRHEQRFNVVWSVEESVMSDLAALSDQAFSEQFQRAFGWRLGRVRAVGQRSQWPLARRAATEQYRSGYLLVGNAAHTLHPVAGQGLNLSLREADLLAQSLLSAKASGKTVSRGDALRPYLNAVVTEQQWVTRSTDLLSTLFNRRGAALDAPRNISLALLDLLPAARKQVARVGTGRRHV